MSDPMYEIFNILDTLEIPPGLQPVFASLKVKIVKTLESFLRQEAKALGYKTVVSLKALQGAARLGKKYLA